MVDAGSWKPYRNSLCYLLKILNHWNKYKGALTSMTFTNLLGQFSNIFSTLKVLFSRSISLRDPEHILDTVSNIDCSLVAGSGFVFKMFKIIRFLVACRPKTHFGNGEGRMTVWIKALLCVPYALGPGMLGSWKADQQWGRSGMQSGDGHISACSACIGSFGRAPPLGVHHIVKNPTHPPHDTGCGLRLTLG